MILPFSINCPWVTPDGQKIPTDFKRKICQKIKIHTFRKGERWKAGTKIHFYMANPRNGGVKFQPTLEAVENWFSEKSQITFSRKKFPIVDRKVFEEEFTPLCHGVEEYRIRVDYNGAPSPGLLFNLEIEGLHIVSCIFDLVTHEVKHISKSNAYPLELIAKNDGLSEVEFLRWFINSLKDSKTKESIGQIIHWTPFRYVADIGAEITDS